MTEEDLSERLATIARDLTSQSGPEQTLDRIVELAAGWIGEDTEAAITLVHARAAVETVAATSPIARRGDELQYELREGPCLDAAWTHELVYSEDLVMDTRWSTWGPRVVETLGVGSMLCLRLFTDETTLGALNLYSSHRSAFDEQARDEAVALSAHAAVALAAARQVDQLKIAVDHRTTIGKALGILMERFALTDDRAWEALRRLSSHENRKLYEIAVELVGTRTLDGIAAR